MVKKIVQQTYHQSDKQTRCSRRPLSGLGHSRLGIVHDIIGSLACSFERAGYVSEGKIGKELEGANQEWKNSIVSSAPWTYIHTYTYTNPFLDSQWEPWDMKQVWGFSSTYLCSWDLKTEIRDCRWVNMFAVYLTKHSRACSTNRRPLRARLMFSLAEYLFGGAPLFWKIK